VARVSVIIPGRCEEYFQQTIDSVLDNAEGDVEVIAIVDGYIPDPPLVARDDRVNIIKLEKSIGQRAGYNLGVANSTGKYVMKLDAHAIPSPGFDVKLQEYCPDDAIVLPEMRRLDVHKWEPKKRGKTHFMFFGLDLYCHFWPAYRKREGVKEQRYPEVMTGQGSCWFTPRKWNDYIGLLDEKVGSWGNVGIEISLRTWLCGGRQLVNKDAWQAHWFRRDEGGFTYPMDGRKVARAHNYTWNNYYFNDHAFDRQVRPFSWIIDKFAPVPGWEVYEADRYTVPRRIIYYTDNSLEDDPSKLGKQVRKRLKSMCGPIPITSISQEPLDFGKNICIGKQPRKYKSVYEAVKVGVESARDDEILYLCEHDVFYHPSHFVKVPDRNDTLYFNKNRYYYSLGQDSFLKARGLRALSQCVGTKAALLQHINEQLADCGDEITRRWKFWEEESSVRCENFESARPNVDILHGGNLTLKGAWKKRYVKGDRKGLYNLPGWGSPKHFMSTSGYKKPKEETGEKEPVMSEKSTAEKVNHKFRRWLPQEYPARIPRFKRNNLAALYASLGLNIGAEVGVREGKFSRVICDANPGVELYCVDVWGQHSKYNLEDGERFLAEAKKRLQDFNATFIREASAEAVHKFIDESLDFVYIDADHSFDHIMQDLIVWSPKVRSGGIVSGHDYYRTRGIGVVGAVDAYTKAHNIAPWFVCDEKEASFFWVKP